MPRRWNPRSCGSMSLALVGSEVVWTHQGYDHKSVDRNGLFNSNNELYATPLTERRSVVASMLNLHSVPTDSHHMWLVRDSQTSLAISVTRLPLCGLPARRQAAVMI